MKKVLVYIKGFSELERVKLAKMTALWISNGSVPPSVLNSLINVTLKIPPFVQFSHSLFLGTLSQGWSGT